MFSIEFDVLFRLEASDGMPGQYFFMFFGENYLFN